MQLTLFYIVLVHQRDPFEWSYRQMGLADNVFDFVGELTPLDNVALETRNLELVSGPRWRLRANKFGQDIPVSANSI